MNYYDFHIHSSFSGDCDIDMEKMIIHAINKNVKALCFTDHYDYDYPTDEIDFSLNIPTYYNTLQEFKLKYEDKIDIRFGIELGIQPHIYDELNRVATKYPFDFIIGSSHVVEKLDPYDGKYFINKTQYQSYMGYLEEILFNVTHYNNYDVYGHLDYIIRYGDYPNKLMAYLDYKDIVDNILLKIIEKGHGIEINTSGIRYKLNQTHPHKDIIRRYKELGGEIITIGSDAHKEVDIVSHFDEAYSILKECGFNYFTIFSNRAPEYVKI